MPDYGRLRAFSGRRIVLDYDTGVKVRGRVTRCVPERGPVIVLHLSDVVFEGPSGEVLSEHLQMPLCPNGLTRAALEEGPSGRSIRGVDAA
jgi:hypothetical protein